MKSKLIAASLAALIGCGSNPPAATTGPSPDTAATESQTVVAGSSQTTGAKNTGKPELGKWGFDSDGMDKAAKPGDAFYQYANGGWSKKTKIPEDKSNYGMFTALDDRSQERTKAIIQTSKGAAGTEAQKIADMYGAFMNEAQIEKLGATPLKADMDRIAAIKDAKGLMGEFAVSARLFRKSPFVTAVIQDDKHPEEQIAILAQSGLGLGDRDMYDTKAAQFEAQRAGYKKYVADMLTLLQLPDAEKRAAAVYALEEKIAKVSWTRTEQRDPVKSYNKMTIAKLKSLAPGVDWKVWLDGAGIGSQKSINVMQPSAIKGIAKLVKSEKIETWRDYMTLRAATDAAPYLSKAFVDLHFAFYGTTMTGTPQNEVRWKRGVDDVTSSMGEAVGKLYVSKHFPPETKAAADKLVKNLLVAMGQRIDALTWMSAETKAKAKEKLATYNPKIGYPTKWRDYSALEVKADDALGNAARAAAFEYNRLLGKLGQPVDRDEWGMTPMTVNAYYNPSLNEIVFPAAILQPPFFDANADDAVNYGGIGSVIGHEISHGFDDQGSQYDAKGALANWWTKDDLKKFKVATAQLVAQYDTYCPAKDKDGKALCVKGEMTLGENIADLAGLTVAHAAYQLSLNGKAAPVIDGVSGDQRFFLGWAQVWRRSYRDQELVNRLTTDVHSPSEFRVAVVRNIDSWYEAFKPSDKEKLFLAPDKRVKIW